VLDPAELCGVKAARSQKIKIKYLFIYFCCDIYDCHRCPSQKIIIIFIYLFIEFFVEIE
jgi:hypothetical protein